MIALVHPPFAANGDNSNEQLDYTAFMALQSGALHDAANAR